MSDSAAAPRPARYARVLRFNQASNRFYHRFVRKEGALPYFKLRLVPALQGAQRAIQLGAGGRDPLQLVSGSASGVEIWSVDPSLSALARNPNQRRIGAWGHEIPLRDASVDLIFSEFLMEHVEDPESTLRESFRLLRPGGALLWVAPNLWSYSGIATHLTPLWFHRLIVRLLQPVQYRVASKDVFPTFFRVNSERGIRRLLADAGFEVEELYAVSGPPHYTKVLPGLHQVAVLLHMVLDRFEALRVFRMNHVVVARKPKANPA